MSEEHEEEKEMNEELMWPIYPIGPTSKPGQNLAIYKARKSGRTLKDIGEEFGLTKERIRQICAKGERLVTYNISRRARMEDIPVLMQDLDIPTRASWMLKCYGWSLLPIPTFVVEVSPEKTLRIPNFGKKSLIALHQAILAVPLIDYGHWKLLKNAAGEGELEL